MDYLNIFEHYKHETASIPLENNLTRIFARILRDNYYVGNNFFDLIERRLIEKGLSLAKEFDSESKIDVDIQRSISNIETELIGDLSDDEKKMHIIGVALTAKNINWENTNKGQGSKEQIPDITILYNGNIYVVEVKKTEEDCQRQLNGYMKELNADEKRCVSITWDDVIAVLERAVEFGYSDVIINEYLDYIRNHFPTLFDYRSLKYSCNENGIIKHIDMVNKRMSLAFKNMQIIDNNNEFSDVYYPYVMFKKNSFQQRIESKLDANSAKFHFTTWLNSTRDQMYNFYNYYENKKFELINKHQDIEADIKYSNQGSGHYYLPLSTDWCGNINLYKILYELLGRSKGEKLKNNTNEIIKLTNSNVRIEDDEKIQDYIYRGTSKDLSIELCISDYIELKELVELDENHNKFNKNMKPEDDKIAKYIYKYIIENLIYQK